MRRNSDPGALYAFDPVQIRVETTRLGGLPWDTRYKIRVWEEGIGDWEITSRFPEGALSQIWVTPTRRQRFPRMYHLGEHPRAEEIMNRLLDGAVAARWYFSRGDAEEAMWLMTKEGKKSMSRREYNRRQAQLRMSEKKVPLRTTRANPALRPRPGVIPRWHKSGPNEFTVELLNEKVLTESVGGGARIYRALADADIGEIIVNVSGENCYNEITGEKAAEVRRSDAQKGWGPLLYDFAALVSTNKYGMPLVSDRFTVSRFAKRVWDFYEEQRWDVPRAETARGAWQCEPLSMRAPDWGIRMPQYAFSEQWGVDAADWLSNRQWNAWRKKMAAVANPKDLVLRWRGWGGTSGLASNSISYQGRWWTLDVRRLSRGFRLTLYAAGMSEAHVVGDYVVVAESTIPGKKWDRKAKRQAKMWAESHMVNPLVLLGKARKK